MIEIGNMIADRYEIVSKIGTGGMSDVYKAKDHTLGRYVAIKVLKSEFSEDSSFVSKFRAEAQAAAGLEHPNIVNVYDVGCQTGNYYIVMEYVEGITLKKYIETKGQLAYKEALSIAIQVGRGIQAAHAKGIIHRDIKPQNIIISTEGKVKVTDFGIARAVSGNTISSDVMGSVHYTSPEQARNGYVSNKSDIYSLGIVMYEMVTGRVPFDGDNTVAVAIQHLQDEMVNPSEYARDLPISLEKIILKCTQKSPDRRYESMDTLLIDLKKSLVTPYEDFVTIAPLVQDKTRVISKEEVEQIQKETSGVTPDEEEGTYEEEPEEELEEKEEDDVDESDRRGRFLNKKMEKAVTIMGIVAAIVIAILVICIVGSFAGVFHFGSKNKNDTSAVSELQSETATVPDLRGKTYDEAQAELKKLGLTLEQKGTEESDRYKEGQIISQDVDAGKKVATGTVVKVIVCGSSSGSEEVDVPDVTGKKLSAAEKELTSAGFQVTREYKTDDSKEAGTVIDQFPAGGKTLAKGETVTIYVAKESENVKVPSLLNKTESEAKQALTDAGLSVGTVTQDYSDTVAEGKVISQSTGEGKYLPKGDTVSFVVSKGKENTTPVYSYKTTIKTDRIVADGNTVNSADITLEASESDEILKSWNGVTSFPFQVNVSNITEASEGTITIVWHYTTSDGTQKTSTQTQEVKFTQVN